MEPSHRSKFSWLKNRNIGRRTGRDIKAGKNIRIREDGFENFDDYLSESDADVTRELHQLKNITEEGSSGASSQEEGKENEGAHSNFVRPSQQQHSTMLSGTLSATQSMLSQNSTMDPSQRSKFSWLKNRNIGRRTGKDIKSNKQIRVDVNGVENFDDYFSESDASSFFSQSSHFSTPTSGARKRRSQVQQESRASQHTSEEEADVQHEDGEETVKEDPQQEKEEENGESTAEEDKDNGPVTDNAEDGTDDGSLVDNASGRTDNDSVKDGTDEGSVVDNADDGTDNGSFKEDADVVTDKGSVVDNVEDDKSDNSVIDNAEDDKGDNSARDNVEDGTDDNSAIGHPEDGTDEGSVVDTGEDGTDEGSVVDNAEDATDKVFVVDNAAASESEDGTEEEEAAAEENGPEMEKEEPETAEEEEVIEEEEENEDLESDDEVDMEDGEDVEKGNEEEKLQLKDSSEKHLSNDVYEHSTESDTENEVVETGANHVDGSSVKLAAGDATEEGSAVQLSRSRSGIDMAGSQSGSISRLGIKSQQSSAVNFKKTKKRLSYSALELSEEGKRDRKSRVAQANQELKETTADRRSSKVTADLKQLNKSEINNKSTKRTSNSIIEDAEVTSGSKRLGDARNHNTSKTIVRSTVMDAEDNHSVSSAGSFLCLASRTKLVQSVANDSDAESDVESICIVEETKPENKKTKQRKKNTSSVSQQIKDSDNVMQKVGKRPKSETKSRKSSSSANNRRNTTHGQITKSDNSAKRKAGKKSSKTSGKLDQIDAHKSVNLTDGISHDVYDIDMENPDETESIISYSKKVSLSKVSNDKSDRFSLNKEDNDKSTLKQNKHKTVKTAKQKDKEDSMIENNDDNCQILSAKKQKKDESFKTKSILNYSGDATEPEHENISSRKTTKSRNLLSKSKQQKSKSSSSDEDSCTKNKTKSLKRSVEVSKGKRKISNQDTSNVESHDHSSTNTSKKQSDISERKSRRKSKSSSSEEETAANNSSRRVVQSKASSRKVSNLSHILPERKSKRHTRASASEEERTVEKPERKSRRSTKSSASEEEQQTVEKPERKSRRPTKSSASEEEQTVDIPERKSRGPMKSSVSEEEQTVDIPERKSRKPTRSFASEEEQTVINKRDVRSKPLSRKVSKRKSSSEEDKDMSDGQEASPVKRSRSTKGKLRQKNSSASASTKRKKVKSSAPEEEEMLDEEAGKVPNSHKTSKGATPKPDSTISASTHFGSGVSFRVSRRSEMLDNVRSGYIDDGPVTVQMESAAGLTPCITQPGGSRKSKGRRVTICPEENVEHDISNDKDEDETRPVSKRLFRHSAGMSTTPLPSPNSTPVHLFETTNNNGPAEEPESPVDDKLILPEPPPEGLRRSQRTRVPTLAWYKGERLIFDNTVPEEPVIVGVKPSLEEKHKIIWEERRKRRKLLSQIRKSTRAEQQDKRPARKLSIHTELPKDLQEANGREITVINPYSQEEDGVECICKGDSRKPVGPHHGSPKKDDPYLITQLVDQPFSSAGVVTLRPRAEKPMQLVQCSAVMFYVAYGKLMVKIHETATLVETGDVFFVPIGNAYSLKNLRADSAKLFYTVHKETGEFGEHSVHYNVIGEGTDPEEEKTAQ